jgi:hypothetical protein
LNLLALGSAATKTVALASDTTLELYATTPGGALAGNLINGATSFVKSGISASDGNVAESGIYSFEGAASLGEAANEGFNSGYNFGPIDSGIAGAKVVNDIATGQNVAVVAGDAMQASPITKPAGILVGAAGQMTDIYAQYLNDLSQAAALSQALQAQAAQAQQQATLSQQNANNLLGQQAAAAAAAQAYANGSSIQLVNP